MGTRYYIEVICPKCQFKDDVYYAPTCGFIDWYCPKCKYRVDLKQYTGITYKDASNADLKMVSDIKKLIHYHKQSDYPIVLNLGNEQRAVSIDTAKQLNRELNNLLNQIMQHPLTNHPLHDEQDYLCQNCKEIVKKE